MGRRRSRGAGGELGARWDGDVREALLGLREWRAAHPQATLAAIEAELDRRWLRLRAQLLEDLALASRAADLVAERPACPDCGARLVAEGDRVRTVVTLGDQAVTLRRAYATCTGCRGRLFPPGRRIRAAAE
jgi:hypothetical protein